MGCNAAKNITVEHLDTTEDGKSPTRNGDADQNDKAENNMSLPLSVNELPPIEVEKLSADVLEPVVNNLQKKSSGLSFDLAFEEDEESIIKKHPPKRFQSIEDRPSTPITLEKLQEKLDEAEIRRQQILTQRIQSAKQRSEMKRQASGESINPDNDAQVLPEDPEALHLSEV